MTPGPRFRPDRWIVRMVSAFVPRRLRADWRRAWEAELEYRDASAVAVPQR